MKRKLRLLVTDTCNRKCPQCCNNKYDLDALPMVETFAGFDEILLTGGEPMLDSYLVNRISSTIRMENKKAKIYMYTAKTDFPHALLITLLLYLDGLTITLHEQDDVYNFVDFIMMLHKIYGVSVPRSLRVSIFKGVNIKPHKALIKCYGWKIKDNLTWQKECPLPKGEVFMRL